MRKLTIVFFEAGGGHRNAADSLKTTSSSPEICSMLNFPDSHYKGASLTRMIQFGVE